MNKIVSVLTSTALGAGALVTLATAVAPAANAETNVLPTGFYQPAYTDAIYHWDSSSRDLEQLTYAQWQDAGAPTPVQPNESTFYLKYSWSPGITGLTYFYESSDAGAAEPVFVSDGLDGAEWSRAGNPQPETVTNAVIPGSVLVSYRSSPELFIFDPTATVHKLTFGEWSELGAPAATPVGEVDKYNFNPTLFLLLDASGGDPAAVVELTSQSWNALANPSPYTAPGRITGDAVFKFSDDPSIYLRTPTKSVWYLSGSDWNSIGSPSPAEIAPPPSGDAAPSAAPAGKLSKDTAKHEAAIRAVRGALGLK